MFKLDPDRLKDPLVELIRRTATDLPVDIFHALQECRDGEPENTTARHTLTLILENIHAARQESKPVCQDTGHHTYIIKIPAGFSMNAIIAQVRAATREATRKSYLRPNAVDPVTGRNSGDNLGECMPSFHFEEWDRECLQFNLLMKGGGCENVSNQYQLPCDVLGAHAGRDLKGVYRVVVDSINKAQGRGCAPSILGVGIGGDRLTSCWMAKKQLFRKLQDPNNVPVLAALEQRLEKDLNRLGIGPMGFGGRTTVLGVKVGSCARIPACYFVSIANACWANRRRSMTVGPGGEAEYD